MIVSTLFRISGVDRIPPGMIGTKEFLGSTSIVYSINIGGEVKGSPFGGLWWQMKTSMNKMIIFVLFVVGLIKGWKLNAQQLCCAWKKLIVNHGTDNSFERWLMFQKIIINGVATCKLKMSICAFFQPKAIMATFQSLKSWVIDFL